MLRGSDVNAKTGLSLRFYGSEYWTLGKRRLCASVIRFSATFRAAALTATNVLRLSAR
jgi:hypothetical protein